MQIYDKRWGFGNNFTWTDEIKDVLDGLLLGDGSLSKNSKISSSFQITQRVDHKDWIDELQLKLASYGIKTNINLRKGGTRISKGITINAKDCYYLTSLFYRTLLDQRKRWYPNNVKIIPKDINLGSPILLAYWFLGDGNSSTTKNTLDIKLHTNCFTEEDVIFLKEQLYERSGLHGTISHWRGQPIIYLQNDHASKFLEKIKMYIPESYKYKIKEKPNVFKSIVCKECGTTFETKYSSFSLYCKNRECRLSRLAKYQRERKKDPTKKHVKKEKQQKNCEFCNASFLTSFPIAKYCKDPICKASRLRIYQQSRRINNNGR